MIQQEGKMKRAHSIGVIAGKIDYLQDRLDSEDIGGKGDYFQVYDNMLKQVLQDMSKEVETLRKQLIEKE